MMEMMTAPLGVNTLIAELQQLFQSDSDILMLSRDNRLYVCSQGIKDHVYSKYNIDFKNFYKSLSKVMCGTIGLRYNKPFKSPTRAKRVMKTGLPRSCYTVETTMVNAILQPLNDNSNTTHMDIGFLEDALFSIREFGKTIPKGSNSAINTRIKHGMDNIIKLIDESLVDVTNVIQNNMRGKSQTIGKKNL